MSVTILRENIHQGNKASAQTWVRVHGSGRAWLAPAGAILVAMALKLSLIFSGCVPFNSDEAVVALMARHILQGERPVFFYGQAYMGSLDAWLAAGVFRVLGEGILGVRLVQVGLYAAYLLSLWLLARRFFSDPRVAGFSVWIAAVPTVLVTTYTTASLGGYGETLVFGNMILLLGYEAAAGCWQSRPAAWIALGAVGGLAFWTLGLAAVYLLPVAIFGLLRFRWKSVPLYLLAGAAFLAASSPWWIYNFSHAGAAFGVLTHGPLALTSPAGRLVGFLLLGLPALLGFRFPWSPELAPWPVLLVGLVAAFGACGYALKGRREDRLGMAPGSGLLLALFCLGFVAVFLGTHFGIDSTGRYFLPLALPAVLGSGALAAAAWRKKPLLALGLLLAILTVNASENWRAAVSADRLTTQFDPITRFDNQADAALVAFLRLSGETHGYSNYWVSFRLAFLSRETLLFAARLPYKADLSYTPADNRYPAYEQAARASPRTAYITSLHPELDRRLRLGLQKLGITFLETQIGPYHVFYHLSQTVRPEELDLEGATG